MISYSNLAYHFSQLYPLHAIMINWWQKFNFPTTSLCIYSQLCINKSCMHVASQLLYQKYVVIAIAMCCMCSMYSYIASYVLTMRNTITTVEELLILLCLICLLMSKTQSADVWVRMPSYVDNANLNRITVSCENKATV